MVNGQVADNNMTDSSLDNNFLKQKKNTKVEKQAVDCESKKASADLHLNKEVENEEIILFHDLPSQLKNQTVVSILVPETGYVCVKISDMQGRTIISSRKLLEKGTHSFKYTPGAGEASYFSAYWNGKSNKIKILHSASVQNRPISIQYLGTDMEVANLSK